MIVENLCGWAVKMTPRRLQHSQFLRDVDSADDFSCLIRFAIPEDSWLTRNCKSLTYDIVSPFPSRVDGTGINAKYKGPFR